MLVSNPVSTRDMSILKIFISLMLMDYMHNQTKTNTFQRVLHSPTPHHLIALCCVITVLGNMLPANQFLFLGNK